MKIIADQKAVFAVLDELLSRWTATPKQFPYNQPKAQIPQTMIPDALRRGDTYTLSCFYFYACIYMRGGIESSQAFRALLRMLKDYPSLFDPLHAQWFTEEYVRDILRAYIGWDSEVAARAWLENSRRLCQTWKADPRLLIKGVADYNEALRRIRNKLTKRELQAAGPDGLGFFGFQPKMVSMLLYFYDWEGWIKKRFLYPAPADFHNFRIAIANGGILITPQPKVIRANEKLSKVWRDVLMVYLKARRADPVEVADAIWLFSLVMCGNSPLTQFRTPNKNHSGMFAGEDLPHHEESAVLGARYRSSLLRTCLVCPLLHSCTLAIPAGPYYQRGDNPQGKGKLGGQLVLRSRFPIERFVSAPEGALPARDGDIQAMSEQGSLFVKLVR